MKKGSYVFLTEFFKIRCRVVLGVFCLYFFFLHERDALHKKDKSIIINYYLCSLFVLHCSIFYGFCKHVPYLCIYVFIV